MVIIMVVTTAEAEILLLGCDDADDDGAALD